MKTLLSFALYTCAAMSCTFLVTGIKVLKGGDLRGKRRVHYIHD